MKLMRSLCLLFAAALVLAVGPIRAAELGEAAGDVKIDKWLKGGMVDVNKGDPQNIYVVEFWATWCGPCRTSIPHLTALQKKFSARNVIIIGITDEKEAVVRKYVDEMGAKMNYLVALDDQGKTSQAFMTRYGVNTIPHAFVVQNRKVLWHGYPMEQLEAVLEAITSGTYDVQKAKFAARFNPVYQEFAKAVTAGNQKQADQLGRQLQALAAQSNGALPQFDLARETRNIRLSPLVKQYVSALAGNDATGAKQLEAQIKALSPGEDLEAIRNRASVLALESQYFQAVSRKGNEFQAGKIGLQLADKFKGDPDNGNQFAWFILAGEKVVHRDYPLALQVARQACEDSNYEVSQILDTYARALFESGKKQEAIDYQEKAIAKAPPGRQEQLEQTLKKYQAAK
jgi:thiol-disulfide isomerase/thioredoxin